MEAIVSALDDPDIIIMIIYILYKHNDNFKKCFKNELNSQFRARSGPIRSDPVVRPDPVNTRTVFHPMDPSTNNSDTIIEKPGGKMHPRWGSNP